ncbi:MAG TPA: hypothetical protein VJ941_11025 [Gracilimonas sp.]|nr:hypothetical protein [Gracilimonas sp.]
MSSIEKLINHINTSSSLILEELDSKDPSFDVIIRELNQREKFVEKLGQNQQVHLATSFKQDELTSIKTQFDAFERLNRNIQDKAQRLLSIQQEKLASAKKTRQAEDYYNFSQNPNISYY